MHRVIIDGESAALLRRAREGPRHPACARPCPRRAEQATWVLSGLCFVWLIFAATQQRDCTRAYPVEEKLKAPLKPWHHMVYIKVGYAGKRLPVAFTRRGTRPRDGVGPQTPEGVQAEIDNIFSGALASTGDAFFLQRGSTGRCWRGVITFQVGRSPI